MTPDGISTEDWDRVHDLALEIVNTSTEGDVAASESASVRMRELLDELQQQYGPLPSLLATRADYVHGVEEREYWLVAAYEQARQRRDEKNLTWIASSLASLHVEKVPNLTEGTKWLSLVEQHLESAPDPSETQEALRLRGILERLNQQPQNNALNLTNGAG